MKFSEKLKKLLEEKKIKQADLCRMTGIQTSLMSDYIGGKKSPSISNAILISDAFGMSLDNLVGREKPEELVTNIQKLAISQIQKMDDEKIKAVLAYIKVLKDIDKRF